MAARTLDQAVASELGNSCMGLRRGEGLAADTYFGPQLKALCIPIVGGPVPGGPISSGGGGGTTQVASSVLKRLKKIRANQQEEHQSAGGGASGDSELRLGDELNLFFSSQYQALDRDETTFEDGYQSTTWGLTTGADIQVADWMRGGLAFNFNRWEGNYTGSGGFATNSYGPLLFASLLPSDQYFADVVFSYAHKDYDRTRFASFSDLGTVLSSGDTSSVYSGDEWSGMVLSGYDYAFDGFIVGPRMGVQYTNLSINGYTEKGNTGLELAYGTDTTRSLQTTLGIRGSGAISTGFGVIIPEASAEWVHEFMNDQRSINVRFAQDFRPTPVRFDYNNERPDRDFAHMGMGISWILPNGIQPYLYFDTLLGHRYYDQYSGSIGARITF